MTFLVPTVEQQLALTGRNTTEMTGSAPSNTAVVHSSLLDSSYVPLSTEDQSKKYSSNGFYSYSRCSFFRRF